MPIPGRESSKEGRADLKIIPHSYLDSRGSGGSRVQVHPPLLIWTTRLCFSLTSNLPLYRPSAEACSPDGPRLGFHRGVTALALFQHRLKNAESAFIGKSERERENVREYQVRKAVNSTLFMSGGPMGLGRTQRSVNSTFHLEQNAASHPKKRSPRSARSSVSKPGSNSRPLQSKRRNTGCD